MIALLTRLTLLLAVLLMPFGMSGAAAASHQLPMTMGTMMAGGCGEHGQAPHGTPAECTMACASALPAAPTAFEPAEEPTQREFGLPAMAQALAGTLLEIATPPPRKS